MARIFPCPECIFRSILIIKTFQKGCQTLFSWKSCSKCHFLLDFLSTFIEKMIKMNIPNSAYDLRYFVILWLVAKLEGEFVFCIKWLKQQLVSFTTTNRVNATAYKLFFECQLLLIKVDIAWVIENKTFLSIPGQHSIRITIIHVIGDVSWTKSNLTYEMSFFIEFVVSTFIKVPG